MRSNDIDLRENKRLDEIDSRMNGGKSIFDRIQKHM
jgi:hypothetical protein